MAEGLILERWRPMWQRWHRATRLSVLAVVWFGLYTALEHAAQFFWFLPAGLMLAGFILIPRRYWAALIVAEIVERLIFLGNFRWIVEGNWPNLFVTTLLQFVPPMLTSLLFGARLRTRGLRDSSDVWFLLGMLSFNALLCGLLNSLMLVTHPFDTPPAPLRFFADVAIGNAAGMFTLFPLLFALGTVPTGALRRAAGDVVVRVLPVVVLFIALSYLEVGGLPPEYLRVLVHFPALLLAWRHGWWGAAIALAVTSGVNGFGTMRPYVGHHQGSPGFEISSQIVMMAIGAAALLLGSAATALRQRQDELLGRNQELDASNQANQSLGQALRDAAQRNLQLEAAQRREIATALHDELGQNLTAMTVRLKLIEDQPHAPSALEPLRDMIDRMRGSVRRLLDNLSPAALDEFGLRRALQEGPVRAMVEDAGLGYRLQIIGDSNDIDALPGHLQSSVYRIVQEAATNTVRHARASTFSIRLKHLVRRDRAVLVLDLRDDGSGITAQQKERRRYGLQGIRDRVLASEGVLHLHSESRGTRLHVMLRVDPQR